MLPCKFVIRKTANNERSTFLWNVPGYAESDSKMLNNYEEKFNQLCTYSEKDVKKSSNESNR